MVSPSWPASGPGLRRTASPARYPAGRRAGGSSAHTPTVLTRGCRRQLDSAEVGSGKPEAASLGTPSGPMGNGAGKTGSQPRASACREGCRSAVFGSAETKPPGWPIVTVPIGQPAGPQVGSQPGRPGRPRGAREHAAFSASVEIFGPGNEVLGDTRTSWSRLTGLARRLAGRRGSSSRKRRRLHGKLRQATG